MIGIYGTLAYGVIQRTEEIGIRIALGARPGQVRSLVVSHGAILTTVGLAIGLVTAAGASRFLEGLLFGLQPLDPWTFALVAVGVAAVSLAAVSVPANRATRVEPLIALRHE